MIAVFVEVFGVEAENIVGDLFVLDELGKVLHGFLVILFMEPANLLGVSVHLLEGPLHSYSGRGIRTLACICHFSNLILQRVKI